MLRITLAGLRAHRLRLLMTALAITVGVGFIAGTFVLTDTLQAGIDAKFARSASKVDVAVLPRDGSGLPVELAARIEALPGAAEVHGVVRGDAALVGRDGKAHGAAPTVGTSIARGALQRQDFPAGRAPVAPDEAVLDEQTAGKLGFRVGDTITVLDSRSRPHRFTLTGLADFAVDSEIGFRGGVGFTPAVAIAMTGKREFTEIDIRAAGSAAQFEGAVARLVGGSYDVVSSRELGDRQARAAGADTAIIRTGLLLFGLVSMLVSALVIYNTFAILIAQRLRELALLRCVGATRRQVFGGVLLESAVVGLVGSLIGLAVGLGLAVGGLRLIGSVDAELPTDGLTLTLRTAMLGLFIGVSATVLPALLPARAATRVAPVAALRTDPEPRSGRFRLGWPRIVTAVVFGLGGLGCAVLGSMIMPKGQTAMFTVAFGGGLLFLGVIAVMPALVRPLSRLVGAVPARLTGIPGRLAVANARRSPRRTATTTIALTIGVGLMTLFAVVAASGKASADASLARQFPVDFQVHTQFAVEGEPEKVPQALANTLRSRPEFADVIEVRSHQTRIADHTSRIGTVTPTALTTGVVNPELHAGSLAELSTATSSGSGTSSGPGQGSGSSPGSGAGSGSGGGQGSGSSPGSGAGSGSGAGQGSTSSPGTSTESGSGQGSGAGAGSRLGVAAVARRLASARGLRVGETFPVQTGRGIVRLRLVAVYGDDTPLPPVVVSEADFAGYFGVQDPHLVYLKIRSGVPSAAAEAALESAAQPYPAVKFSSAAALKAQLNRAIDTIFLVFGGLLALAIVIALFGIANTLSLSVVERTRESALLRALGLTKRQLRGMLSVEAFVMAVIGALVGVTLGTVFGWAATTAMAENAVFSLPYLQIGIFMALAGAAGMLAAVLPARRAARASVVESLSHD